MRVYSPVIEFEDFPMPGQVSTCKASERLDDSQRNRSLRSVSLHEMVRSGDSSMAQFIRSIDQHILRSCHHDNADDDDVYLTPSQLKQYHAAIKEREQELLKKADVILCTCVTAGASRINLSTNILQVCPNDMHICFVASFSQIF